MRNRKRILLVSNDEAITDTMIGMSEEAGWQITVHRYGLRTLVLFRDDPSRFDLIMVDEGVDDVPGPALAAQLLSIEGTVRIILLLAKADAETEFKARPSGVLGLLTKPVSPEELVEAVQKALDDTYLVPSVAYQRSPERSNWLRDVLRGAGFGVEGSLR